MGEHYYASAYRPAAEAEEPELAATCLCGMMVQSINMGHRHNAKAYALAER